MAGLLERLKAVPAALTRLIPKPKGSRSVVQTHRLDEMAYKRVREHERIDSLVWDTVLGDVDKGGTRQPYDAGAELVHDLFMSFYKANPTLLGKSDVAPEVYPVRRVIEEMLATPRLQEMQEHTVGDVVLSALAVETVFPAVRDILERVQPPPPPEPEAGDDSSQEGDQGDGGQSGDQPGDQPGGDGEPGDGQGDQPGGDGPTQAELDWQAAFDEVLDEVDFERALRGPLEQADTAVGELDAARHGVGLEDGEWEEMDPQQRFEAAEWLSTPHVKALSDMIGRVGRCALGLRGSRVTDAPHERFTIEAGDDLKRVLPSELALLGHPATQIDFYSRYLDRRLFQYKVRGSEVVGKGPIVAAIDKSFSMDGAPFMWAMGVGEALRRFAALDERDYFAMFFGRNDDRHRFEFPGGTGPFEQVRRFLSAKANGGTEFDGVLTEALQRAASHFDATGEGKADIVFVTDGIATLAEEWITAFLAEKERVGVRLFSVYIGGAKDGPRNPVPLLERISDLVIPVTDLRPEAVRDIFERV